MNWRDFLGHIQETMLHFHFRLCFEHAVSLTLDQVMSGVVLQKFSATQEATEDSWKMKKFELFYGSALKCLIGFAANAWSTPLNRKKVLETFYRAFAYTVLFGYGVIVLYDKEWLYNFRLCWVNYPAHNVDSSLW